MLVGSLALMSGCTAQKTAENTATTAGSSAQLYTRNAVITSAVDAQKLLEEGNARFVGNKVLNDDLSSAKRDDLYKNGQKPFAIIIGCSDSRVPPEVLFDQALGDLFVVRDAGNVVDSIATGSVEYAAEHLKSPLVVVLGHEKCGAVTAAVNGGEIPGSIASIANKIKPSVDKAKAEATPADKLVEKSAELNVENTIVELEKSPIIKELVESGKLTIVGAKYQLATGQVEWYKPAKAEASNAEGTEAAKEAPTAEKQH